jgi:hypothetical protein
MSHENNDGWKEWQGENLIDMYFHCGDCVKEKPEGFSMEEYARLNVGIVFDGEFLQIWCVRHNKHVAMLRLHPEVTLAWQKGEELGETEEC